MNSVPKLKIYSIGHSNRTFGELVSVLKRYGIETLADIRSHPRSGRNPHFDKESLERELPTHGIDYVWIKELGGRRKGGYESYTKTDGFRSGLDKLISEAKRKKTAFMCSELSWRRCHRSFVAGALCAKGWDVVHIYGESEAETHADLPGLYP